MKIKVSINFCFCIIFSVQISLSQQDEFLSTKPDQIHKNKRIMYQAETCSLNDSIYDQSTSGACFKCTDQFILPDCSMCPFGYKIAINNQIKTCEKCSNGQVFCDEQVTSKCFNGYTQDPQTRQCSCKSPSTERYEWCTDDQQFYYYSFYQDGQIKSKFSAEISLNMQISMNFYEFSIQNCVVLENLETNYFSIKDEIECRIDPDQRNVFAINLKNIDVTNKSYEDVPIFNKNLLLVQLGINKIENAILIYQDTNQDSTKKVYINLNQQSNDECQFKQNLYRLIPGNNVIPKDHLLIKNFDKTIVNFKIQQQQGTDNPEINAEILNGLNQYPNDMIFNLPNFSEPENQLVYQIPFQCQLPFGLLSTSQFQIIYQKQYSFEYQITLNDSYYNSDQISVQINVSEGSFQDGDSFVASFTIEDTLNQEFEFFTQEFSFQGGVYSYLIEPFQLRPNPNGYTLNVTFIFNQIYHNKSFQFKLKIRYLLEQESQTVSRSFRVDESPFYCQIIGGDQQNINPSNVITIVGQIFSSIHQDSSDYLYTWSCLDQNADKSCEDKFQNTLQFQSSNEITIPADSFNLESKYIIELYATLISNKQVNYSTSIQITTRYQSIDVQFDADYTRNGLRFDQLLQFNLMYSQSLGEARRLLWVASKNYQHHFEILFQDQPIIVSESQIEPQFYFRLQDLTKLQVQDNMQFQIKFYVTYVFGTLSESKKYNFFIKPLPQGCSLQFSQLSGLEKAFNDLINIDIQNCLSFNGDLYYIFMYQKENDIQIQINTNSDFYQSSYLTKFSLNKQISTYLPSGKITIRVAVKDIDESKVLLQQSITIQKSQFNSYQYENFIINQFKQANNYKNNKQFEEELCTIGIIIDCIIDFESENINEDPNQSIVDIKISLNNRLKTLPTQISNNQMSQQLQEYILRCLDKLLKTKKSPNYDNIMSRFDQLQEIIQASVDQIEKLNPFLQEVKDTYKQQMIIAFNMTIQYINQINQNPSNSDIWNDKQVQGIQKIQNCIALTLNINESKIELSSDILQIIVHRVDFQLLQKEYLIIEQENNQLSQYGYGIVYDVKQQNWNNNVYAKGNSFREQFDSYYQNASEDIKKEFDRVYPAINSEISVWQDIPIYQRRRNLLLNKVENLVLPSNSSILYQFNNIDSNSGVVCTQKISEVWSKKLCQTEFQNINGIMKVICSCSKPSYTTLIYDFQSLLQNENVGEILSLKGIIDIFNWTNWYEYAAIYTIFIINLGFIIALIFVNKKDKKGLFGDKDVFVFMQSQCLQRLQLQRYSDNEVYKSESESQGSKNIDMGEQKNIQNKENSIDINKYQLNTKTMEDLKRSHQTTEHISSESIIRIQFSDKKINVNKQPNNITDIEQNKEQINTLKVINILNEAQLYDQPGIRQHFVESENKVLHLHQSNIEQNQNDDKIAKQKLEQLKRIKSKSQQFLQGITKIKAVLAFHQFFQIFLLFNKKNSRIFRLCIYYSNIIWLLAINATFGKSLTISQVLILSFISSVTFGVYSFIFQLLQKNNILRYFSYFICFCFLIFCYYAIFVSMSNSSYEEANIWIFGYFLTLALNIFVFGIIIAIIKLFLTKKLIESLSPESFVFSITGADAIFQMFE